MLSGLISVIYSYYLKYNFAYLNFEISVFLLFALKNSFCSLKKLFYFCGVNVQKYESQAFTVLTS